MIKHEEEYLRWIISCGVGSNDKVASSPKSYISYLNSVSRILNIDVSPKTLSSVADIVSIALRLNGKRADKTINNYKSAMKQYVSMVIANSLV